jgi:hypothetical protein
MSEEEITEVLETALANPLQSTTIDGQSATAVDLEKLIAMDRHLGSRRAKKGWSAVQIRKVTTKDPYE